MLMCITQFSKEKESIKELLKQFSKTLSALSYSTCCIHLKIEESNQASASYCDNEDIAEDLKNLLGLPSIPEYLQHTLQEKHPQINLLPDNLNLNPIEEKLASSIGSYLAFPISDYNKLL